MKFFSSKEENNYAYDIAKLKESQNEISIKTKKNTSDVLSLGLNFDNYKSDTNETLKELIRKIGNLESSLEILKQERTYVEDELKDIQKAKEQLSDDLSYKDICNELDIPYLTETTLKYYLYECGLLELKINKANNRYRISGGYDDLSCDIKRYSHITGKVFTFDRGIICYLKEHEVELKESIYRYLRKLKQFNDSKEILGTVEIKNFQKEVGNICGTKDTYDKDKWMAIYNRYELDHPNYRKLYDTFSEEYMNEHPNAKYKPSVIKYLVQECGDGDVILKIACELFVD